MNTIIITSLVALGVAFVLGVLLGLFKKIFAVEVDPKVAAIRELLSGGNCGGCGFAGCDAFAAAVVKGEVPANGCVAGGPTVAKIIGEMLGQNVSAEKKVTILACQGSNSCAKQKGVYQGVKSCAAAQMAINGTKICSYGCIGFGDCVLACPFDALQMSEDNLPVVNYTKCVGCAKCVTACPKKLFSIVNASQKGAVTLCANRSENKPEIKKNCSKGCIKCGICVRKCPEQCIEMQNGIPVMDYTKCTSCGECVRSCPDKAIALMEEIFA